FRGAVSEIPAGAVSSSRGAAGAQEARAAGTVRRVRWLTRRGAAAALAIGLATVWGFGWRGLFLLLAFFVSSNLLTTAAKGGEGRRNERQVLANGTVGGFAGAGFIA